ncbi:hypothetical protein CRENBAI_025131 [Crenichthys baileyi]|uniref:Uncharacterized protein n=1 Tax=Crenichthys baileyi TaxID=28760 RepID=A0AAV9SGQ6_9TELE
MDVVRTTTNHHIGQPLAAIETLDTGWWRDIAEQGGGDTVEASIVRAARCEMGPILQHLDVKALFFSLQNCSHVCSLKEAEEGHRGDRIQIPVTTQDILGKQQCGRANSAGSSSLSSYVGTINKNKDDPNFIRTSESPPDHYMWSCMPCNSTSQVTHGSSRPAHTPQRDPSEILMSNVSTAAPPTNHHHKQLQERPSPQYKESVVTLSAHWLPPSHVPLKPPDLSFFYDLSRSPEKLLVFCSKSRTNDPNPPSRMAAVQSAPNYLHGCRTYGILMTVESPSHSRHVSQARLAPEPGANRSGLMKIKRRQRRVRRGGGSSRPTPSHFLCN